MLLMSGIAVVGAYTLIYIENSKRA